MTELDKLFKKSSLKKDATTLGVGAAAGAAGYGAAKLFSKSDGEAAAAGVVTAGVASLLAHLINKKLSERPPLMSPGNAGVTSVVAGAGTGAAALGGMNFIHSKLGPYAASTYQKVLNSIAPSASAGPRNQNALRTVLRDTHDDIANSYNKWLADLAREARRRPTKLDPSKPSKLVKLLNSTLHNKKKAASLLLGAAAIPAAYNFIRGNGSD